MLPLSPSDDDVHLHVDLVVDDDGKLLLDVPNAMSDVDFPDSHYDFLDSIDFDDIFSAPDDLLPGLEAVVPELSASRADNVNNTHSSSGGERMDGMAAKPRRRSDDKRRKSSSKDKSKGSGGGPPPREGKRKVKVDWTPELHNRFVEAVEKLGVDKAVPSRILEVMGARSLTRHNIASHLQKFRSHRKHVLAREAEAASWNQRRRMYAAPHLGSTKDVRALAPWVAAPAMGFPSAAPPQHHYRPLHVWGHPTMNRPIIRPWPSPNHVPNHPPLPMPWAATTMNPPYWTHPQHHQAAILPPLPAQFFTQPMVASGTGFVPPPPVPGVPPPTMFETDRRAGTAPQPPEFHLSKETIDAAIGEVLTNQTLPLPLGLKPPSMEGVIGELQRQGLTKIPPPSPSLLEDDHRSLSTTSTTTTFT